MILRYIWATSSPRYSIGHYTPGNEQTMDCGWEEVARFPLDRSGFAVQVLGYFNGGRVPSEESEYLFFTWLNEGMQATREADPPPA